MRQSISNIERVLEVAIDFETKFQAGKNRCRKMA